MLNFINKIIVILTKVESPSKHEYDNKIQEAINRIKDMGFLIKE